jgi:hypothetical protein
MANENKKMEGAAGQADLNKANANGALQALVNLALQVASQQQNEVQRAANVLERVIHDAGETWTTPQEGENTDEDGKKN